MKNAFLILFFLFLISEACFATTRSYSTSTPIYPPYNNNYGYNYHAPNTYNNYYQNPYNRFYYPSAPKNNMAQKVHRALTNPLVATYRYFKGTPTSTTPAINNSVNSSNLNDLFNDGVSGQTSYQNGREILDNRYTDGGVKVKVIYD